MPRLKNPALRKSPIERLGKVVKKNGFTYKLVERVGDVALYEQRLGRKLVGHEVFFVKVQKAKSANFGGVQVAFEPKEKFPSNESFGKWAWSVGSDVSVAKSKFRFVLYKSLNAICGKKETMPDGFSFIIVESRIAEDLHFDPVCSLYELHSDKSESLVTIDEFIKADSTYAVTEEEARRVFRKIIEV